MQWLTNGMQEFEVVPSGFEPESAGPKPTMMDLYTKGL